MCLLGCHLGFTPNTRREIGVRRRVWVDGSFGSFIFRRCQIFRPSHYLKQFIFGQNFMLAHISICGDDVLYMDIYG